MYNAARPTVLNLVATFLPLSENWIYDQATSLERYRAVFAARRLRNLSAFPFEGVHSVAPMSLPWRVRDQILSYRNGRSPFFEKVAERENASLIHAHSGPVGADAVAVARAARVPLVTSFHGVDLWKGDEGLRGLRRKYASLFAHGSLFLVEGPAACAQLAHLGCNAARIVVHRRGVDVASISPHARTLLRGNELRVLMASKFVEKKGLRYGVEAFARVARDTPSMRLTIVGRGSSSGETAIGNELHDIARRYGVASQIETLGFLPLHELQTLAYRHHVFLHPSVRAANGDAEGGHPVVMTMLAASGMPILATRHCDIPEVVSEGRTGWLVEEKDVDGLEGILREVVRDPSVLPAYSRRARELVEGKYDIRKNRLDDIYDEVLKPS